MLCTAKCVMLIAISLAKTQECLSGVEKLTLYGIVYILCIFAHSNNVNLRNKIMLKSSVRICFVASFIFYELKTRLLEVIQNLLGGGHASLYYYSGASPFLQAVALHHNNCNKKLINCGSRGNRLHPTLD